MKRSFTQALVAGLVAASSPSMVFGADVEITIDEEAPNQFANLVQAEGQGSYTLSFEIPCLFAQFTLPAMRARFNPQIGRIRGISRDILKKPEIFVPRRITCTALLGPIFWSWHVMEPRFEIEPDGVRLTGKILAEHASGSSVTSFDLPVGVVHQASQDALHLILEESEVTVQALVGGDELTLGTIDLAPFYETSLALSRAVPTAGAGVVTTSLGNVTVDYLDGRIRVAADVNYE